MLAFHFDLKAPMWTEEFMDAYSSTLAAWGYNAILYEVEDKLRYSNHPAIAHVDALSPAQTQARAASLRKRGLNVIPLVHALGHAGYVLTKPGYERFRESPAHTGQYHPLSAESRELICELIDETIDATQADTFFHLGGDETWSLGQSESCRSLLAEIGPGGLYLRHMLPIIEHVIGRGLRPILWADIALIDPEIIPQFPRDVLWMDWDYWSGGERWDNIRIWNRPRPKHVTWQDYPNADFPPGFRRYLEPFAIDEQTRRDGTFRGFPYVEALRELGVDVVAAPATRCWGDAAGIPYNTEHLPNCYFGGQKGRNAGVGTCVTSWAVRRSHPLVNLPGAFAAAQGFASDSPCNFQELARKYTEQRFGVAMPEFAEALHLAEVRVPWCRARKMRTVEESMSSVQAWLDELDGKSGGQLTIMEEVEIIKRLNMSKASGSGRQAMIEEVEKSAGSLSRAEIRLCKFQEQAHIHADDFDYWLEGVRHTAFCADFSLALLQDSLAVSAPGLLKRLNTLREQSRQLFLKTFPPASVEAELAVRYEFLEVVLKN